MSCATPDIVMFTLPCCCVWFMSDFDVFTNLDRISRDSYALWLHINAFDQLNLVWIFLHVKNRCASAFVLVPSSLSLGCMHSFLLLLSAHSSMHLWQLQQNIVSNMHTSTTQIREMFTEHLRLWMKTVLVCLWHCWMFCFPQETECIIHPN